MHEIVEGVYLGDVKDVKNAAENGIKHVISVINVPVDLSEFSSKLQIEIEDSPTTNILQHFQSVIDFIRKFKNEKTLIHCFAGSSRSVAVLSAYLLTENLVSSVDAALDFIVEKGASPNPNEGFLEQLELWVEMGCKIDPAHYKFKEFNLKMHQEAALLSEGKENLKKLVSLAPSERDNQAWKCKKCRRALFRDSSILPHDESAKVKSFAKGRSGKVMIRKIDKQAQSYCSSVFVEPIAWMTEILEGNRMGSLLCPKCKQKVGHFDWAGLQCSCGKWVSPAFQIQKKQVDEPIRC